MSADLRGGGESSSNHASFSATVLGASDSTDTNESQRPWRPLEVLGVALCVSVALEVIGHLIAAATYPHSVALSTGRVWEVLTVAFGFAPTSSLALSVAAVAVWLLTTSPTTGSRWRVVSGLVLAELVLCAAASVVLVVASLGSEGLLRVW